MLKMTVKYLDFNNVERTEDHYFHMSRIELTRWYAEFEGDFAAQIQNAVKTGDYAATLKYFEELVRRSYGVKSDDGTKFIKDPEQTRDFMESAAYDEMFYRITQSKDEATNFISSIIPKMDAATLRDAKPPKMKDPDELAKPIEDSV